MKRREPDFGAFKTRITVERRLPLPEKYSRFVRKALSFYGKSTIILPKKYYRFN